MYKRLSELEKGKEYEILDYNLKFVESLNKNILNVTINIDGLECSVGLPDKIKRRFEALSRSEQDEIIGRKFKYDIKCFSKPDGVEIIYYNVKFVV